MFLSKELYDKDPTFWNRVQEAPEGVSCWNWTGALCDGYGSGPGGCRAHRRAYTLAYGDIPSGLQINHRCNNPKCCNPSHLYAGTQSQNMRDKVDSGRFNYRKRFLTEEQVLKMRSMNVSSAVVAREFGISRSHAKNVLNGTRWPSAGGLAK